MLVPHADGNVPGLSAAADVLQTQVATGRLPAAVLEIGNADRVLGRVAVGAPDDAVFDLASLTKVLGTGLIAIDLVGRGRLNLDARVATLLQWWRGADRAAVTVRDLLVHASGLPAHLPLYAAARTPLDVVRGSADAPLSAPPRTVSIYSDLGFIVLGDLLARALREPWAEAVHQRLGALSDDPPTFWPPAGRLVLATGRSAWRGRDLCGEVHDDNAAAMGGVAGHAGLFGSARGVGDVARAVLAALTRGIDLPWSPAWTVRAFARQTVVPGSSRALAWDTALPTSSSGPYLSRRAIGHTGFTGTSLWIDPVLDLYVVLLTNRVAGPASSDEMATVRREIHTIVGAAWRNARAA